MLVVIQNTLPHYRRAFFNHLCSIDEVLVIHSGKKVSDYSDKFNEIIVPSVKIGPFVWQAGIGSILDLIEPRFVVASADIRNVHSILAMYRFSKKLRWVWWGLDFGSNRFSTIVKRVMFRRSEPIIFYNEYIKHRFIEYGFSPQRLFVANNTFHVEKRRSLADETPKNVFLNVGSLDKRKKNDYAIRAFDEVLKRTGADIYFYLIGDGLEKSYLEKLIRDLQLQSRVKIIKKIEDSGVLEYYYSRAIASVSFGQAGLTVLQSMAYGVPFITKFDAISGGEKFNITNEYNGLFVLDDVDSLARAMIRLVQNPLLARRLGNNAYEYYSKKATVSLMVEGFYSALTFQGT